MEKGSFDVVVFLLSFRGEEERGAGAGDTMAHSSVTLWKSYISLQSVSQKSMHMHELTREQEGNCWMLRYSSPFCVMLVYVMISFFLQSLSRGKFKDKYLQTWTPVTVLYGRPSYSFKLSDHYQVMISYWHFLSRLFSGVKVKLLYREGHLQSH